MHLSVLSVTTQKFQRTYILQKSKTHNSCICLCYLSPHKNFKELTFFKKVKHMIAAFVCVICHHTKISKNLDHLVCCFHITILCMVLLMFRKLGSAGAEWSLVTSYSCQVSWKSFSCFVIMRKGQMYGHGNT